MNKIERRDFLKKSSLVIAGGTSALLYACGESEKKESVNINFNETYQWNMVTSWAPNFPLLGEGASNFAKKVDDMSGGRLKIRVYGGGELVPALEVFDAVSQGTAEMGHSASYYWAGKVKAAQFFTSLPFGMNTQQTNAWLQYGDGMELWQDTYNSFNIVPFACGNTGAQMGGWFNKEINSVNDLRGLKMRFPGIGGSVINKAGGSAILSAGGEIYTNLERGVIDATDWIGPYHDYLMGFHEIAKYYYYPSWAEPTGVVELIINKTAYESLPKDLQIIIKNAAEAVNLEMLGAFEEKNSEYYAKIKNETDVQLREFPDEVMATFRKYSKETIEEIVESDAQSRKIFESYNKFHKQIYQWSYLAEQNYEAM